MHQDRVYGTADEEWTRGARDRLLLNHRADGHGRQGRPQHARIAVEIREVRVDRSDRDRIQVELVRRSVGIDDGDVYGWLRLKPRFPFGAVG